MRLPALFISLTLALLLAAAPAKAAEPDYGNAQRLSLPAPDKNGGALQFYSINSNGFFENICIDSLNQGEAYTDSPIYKALN